MSERKPILIEISPGELIDRLTILQIRAEHVTDPVQHRLVHEELERLSHLRDEVLPANQEVEDLIEELRGVNEALWEMEDDIRAADAAGEFGAEFIELAQSVCRTNDRRAELKRRINALFGWAGRDEKHYRACDGRARTARGLCR